MDPLTKMSRDEATLFTRVVRLQEQFTGATLTAMAGTTQVHFASLREVEGYLDPVSAEELSNRGVWAEIKWLDPKTLVSWVRDTIGDAELAEQLDRVVATDRPYGFLVPEIKQLLADRLAQCEAALAEE